MGKELFRGKEGGMARGKQDSQSHASWRFGMGVEKGKSEGIWSFGGVKEEARWEQGCCYVFGSGRWARLGSRRKTGAPGSVKGCLAGSSQLGTCTRLLATGYWLLAAGGPYQLRRVEWAAPKELRRAWFVDFLIWGKKRAIAANHLLASAGAKVGTATSL